MKVLHLYVKQMTVPLHHYVVIHNPYQSSDISNIDPKIDPTVDASLMPHSLTTS